MENAIKIGETEIIEISNKSHHFESYSILTIEVSNAKLALHKMKDSKDIYPLQEIQRYIKEVVEKNPDNAYA